MKTFTYTALGLAAFASAAPLSSSKTLVVPDSPPKDANSPLDHFLSYSIEFSSFADFAGNLSKPNTYSYILLKNLAAYAGSLPLVRVGGNTQDLTLFDASQKLAVIQSFSQSNPDYPANQTIGPAFFESYRTWPGVHFSHGFNLADNSSEHRQSLLDSVPFVCRALQDRFYGWELGNEPDLFNLTLAQAPPRGSDWTEKTYVAEWLEWARKIRQKVQKACPKLASSERFKFLAPSLAGNPSLSKFSPAQTFVDGLNDDNTVGIISQHKYIGARGNPGITLQGTLMNHTNNKRAVSELLVVKSSILSIPDADKLPKNAPYILGEGNSLARQGIGGVSNSFGAALWGFDYALTLASSGIGRWHMHQGTNYRYQAWQPIETKNTTKGTKAPYYGNIATAAFLGYLTKHRPQIVDLELPGDFQSAFALYKHGKLAKVAVLNLQSYNTSEDNPYKADSARPLEIFALKVTDGCKGASLQRLTANGSDAITGVTFDGFSYAAELDGGRPVRLANVTRGERVFVERGMLSIEVEASSAVIVSLY